MSYNYQGQPSQYGTHQTNATGVPQQQRQHIPSALASTSPQVLVSSSRDYPQQQTYPSYNGAQPGYADPTYGTAGGFSTGAPSYPASAQGNPGFPVPHPAGGGGSHQRGHSGQSETLYPGGSILLQRSPSGQSTTLYAPAGGSTHHRSPSGQSATLYAPAGGSTHHRSPSGQSATLYPASSSLQRSPSGQSASLYPGSASISVPRSYAGQSSAHQYPPAQTYDSTSSSYPGPQATSYRHGTHATSDGPRSGNSYQTAVPGMTRVSFEQPAYGGTQERGGSYSQPQRTADAYGYGNEGHITENRPKSPGRGPVQGRQHTCRLQNCNNSPFFDRRFNDFWEWCSLEHIQAGLRRGMEKPCRTCGVWPRKYGHKHCGGPSCNKNGLPLSY